MECKAGYHTTPSKLICAMPTAIACPFAVISITYNKAHARNVGQRLLASIHVLQIASPKAAMLHTNAVQAALVHTD